MSTSSAALSRGRNAPPAPREIPDHVSPGLWTLAWRRLKADRVGMVSLAIVVAFIVLMVLSATGLVAKDWSREFGVNYAPPTFVGPDEMRALKREHLGFDEATDVLSFPIDGRDEIPEGTPRVLGDVVLCPQVVGAEWRAPLVHGLLHLLGYDHGPVMEAREDALAPR